MATRKYSIKLNVITTEAEAAYKRASAAAGETEKAAGRVATAAEKAADRAIKAAERIAEFQSKVSIRSADRAVEIAQRAADRKVAIDERAADRSRSSVERLAEFSAKMDLRGADRKAAILDRAMEREQKATERAAERRERAAERESDKVRREAEKTRIAQELSARLAADSVITEALRMSRGQVGALAKAAAAAEALEGKILRISAAYAGMGAAAVAAYKSVLDSANAANEAAKQHAESTIGTREQLQEIATIRGKAGVDDEEIARFMKMRTTTGLSNAEALAYTTEVENAIGTVNESKLPGMERQNVVQEGAKVVGRLGGGATTAKAAGTILGLLPNYAKGPTTGLQNAAMFSAMNVISQRGAGDVGVATQQLAEVMTTMTAEDTLGRFHDPRKAAALQAIASKFGPAKSAEFSVQALRGVSAITKFRKGEGVYQAQSKFLQDIGITEFMDPQQKLETLFKQIDKDTEGGKKEAINAYLQRRGFKNQEEYLAIEKLFESYKHGNWKEIMALADKPLDVAGEMAKFEAYKTSRRGENRLAEAHLEAARVEQGLREEPLEILRKRGQAEIVRRQLDQSTLFNMGQWIQGVMAGSQTRGRQITEERLGLEARAGELGYKPHVSGSEVATDTAMMQAMGPIGPLMSNVIRSATGVNQARALDMDAEAKRRRVQAEAAAKGAQPAKLPRPGPQAMLEGQPFGFGLRGAIAAAMVGAVPGHGTPGAAEPALTTRQGLARAIIGLQTEREQLGDIPRTLAARAIIGMQRDKDHSRQNRALDLIDLAGGRGDSLTAERRGFATSRIETQRRKEAADLLSPGAAQHGAELVALMREQNALLRQAVSGKGRQTAPGRPVVPAPLPAPRGPVAGGAGRP